MFRADIVPLPTPSLSVSYPPSDRRLATLRDQLLRFNDEQVAEPVSIHLPQHACGQLGYRTSGLGTTSTRSRQRASKPRRGLTSARHLAIVDNAAVWKSRHMAFYGYMAHDDPAPPVTRTTGDRLEACGYPATRSGWGENIAWGYSSPESVMQGWLSIGRPSRQHRESILEGDRHRSTSDRIGRLFWTRAFGVSLQSTPGVTDHDAANDHCASDDDASADYHRGANDNSDDDPSTDHHGGNDDSDTTRPPTTTAAVTTTVTTTRPSTTTAATTTSSTSTTTAPPTTTTAARTGVVTPNSATVFNGRVRGGSIVSITASDQATVNLESTSGVVAWYSMSEHPSRTIEPTCDVRGFEQRPMHSVAVDLELGSWSLGRADARSATATDSVTTVTVPNGVTEFVTSSSNGGAVAVLAGLRSYQRHVHHIHRPVAGQLHLSVFCRHESEYRNVARRVEVIAVTLAGTLPCLDGDAPRQGLTHLARPFAG